MCEHMLGHNSNQNKPVFCSTKYVYKVNKLFIVAIIFVLDGNYRQFVYRVNY